MTSLSKNMLLASTMLGLFAIVTTTMVALVHDTTEQQIQDNKREYTLKQLHELIPPQQHDNDLNEDKIQVSDPLLAPKQQTVTIYRARQQNQPVAAIIQCIAPDGYSGKIVLLVAIKMDGQVAGVRVTNHKETPGLGDAIERNKSDWITLFDGKSQQQPKQENWRVRKDGGEFDQITSATITSRAVVNAVYKALTYFETNKATLFN